LPGGKFHAGYSLVLIPYEHPISYLPFMQTKPSPPLTYKVWEISAQGEVNTHGVPIDGSPIFHAPQQNPSEDLIKSSIKADTPEEVGLNAKLMCVLSLQCEEMSEIQLNL
jgi:hypothetical protein